MLYLAVMDLPLASKSLVEVQVASSNKAENWGETKLLVEQINLILENNM